MKCVHNTTSLGNYNHPEKFMSPISSILRDLRFSHGLRQFELAEQVGCEQSFISGLELGIKGPPSREFIKSLISALQLDAAWQARLWSALEMSQRKILLPNEAPEEIYWLCNELRLQLDQLHPTQVELMRSVLRLPRTLNQDGVSASKRIKRRNATRTAKVKEEMTN